MKDPDSRLTVAVTDGRGRAIADGGLARWLRGVAPRAARGEMAIAIVSDVRMQALNQAYRGKNRPTDVLSFPAEEIGRPSRARFLGDLAIARGVAARQAREHGHPLATELRILALHGLLHLIGYDHDSPGDQGRMQRLEARLRRKGGLERGLIERSRGR